MPGLFKRAAVASDVLLTNWGHLEKEADVDKNKRENLRMVTNL